MPNILLSKLKVILIKEKEGGSVVCKQPSDGTKTQHFWQILDRPCQFYIFFLTSVSEEE